jgi:hypothetical protein
MFRTKIVIGILLSVLLLAGTGLGEPDLIVSDITESPANPAVGSIVTFKVTIKNQGITKGNCSILCGIHRSFLSNQS